MHFSKLYEQTKKNEKWSLEHIHAQNSEDITKRENQISWLNDHINSLSKQNNEGFKELIVEMETLKNAETIDKDAFNALVKKVYEAVNKLSGTTQKEGHTISNLCLVDARTNSKLNNSVFDVKREIIKKQELDGFYIPICTRNVFLKAYSEYPLNNAYWTADDRKGYLESVRNTYDFFVNSNNKNS